MIIYSCPKCVKISRAPDFHYCPGDDGLPVAFERIEVIPRAVADELVEALGVCAHSTEAGGKMKFGAIAKYREAVGECAQARTLEHVESTGERVRRRIAEGSQDA